jgi:hypothetical protein
LGRQKFILWFWPQPDEKLAMNQKVYAELVEDENGFARIAKVSAKYYDNEAYVQCRVNSVSDSLVYLQLPFDRYYYGRETRACRRSRLSRTHQEGSARRLCDRAGQRWKCGVGGVVY